MKKKIIIFLVLIGTIVGVIIARNMHDAKLEEKYNNKIKIIYNERYCKDLCIENADYEDVSDVSEILELSEISDISEASTDKLIYDARTLQVRVAFYNITHEPQITVKDVIDGFIAFRAGDIFNKDIASLVNYSQARHVGVQDEYIALEDKYFNERQFFASVYKCVFDEYGTFNHASEETVAEMIEYVIAHPELIYN